MVAKVLADASPEKRLFISLITRDISLAEAARQCLNSMLAVGFATPRIARSRPLLQTFQQFFRCGQGLQAIREH